MSRSGGVELGPNNGMVGSNMLLHHQGEDGNSNHSSGSSSHNDMDDMDDDAILDRKPIPKVPWGAGAAGFPGNGAGDAGDLSPSSSGGGDLQNQV